MGTSKKSSGTQSSDPMLFAEDTLASLLAPQANDAVRTTPDTCGRGFERPLADYDPDTQSWRMFGDTSLWEGPPCLESLPPSGMTRNGVLYLQPPWVPITGEIESSLWPTPTAVKRAMEGNVRLYRAKVQAGEMTEAEAEAILGKSVWESQGKIPAMWPTPTTDDASNVNPKPNRFRGLVAAVNETMWPTPKSSDYKAAVIWPKEKTHSRDMALRETIAEREPSAIGGKLNPTWVEWLMGFPTGWTDLEA